MNPEKVGSTDPLVTSASDFGGQREHWNGVDITMDARLANGVFLKGGISAGKTMTDTCSMNGHPEVTRVISIYNPIYPDAPPHIQNLFPLQSSTDMCSNETPFLTQVKFLGGYTFPYDIQVAGTLQSLPGPVIAANAIYLSSQIQQSLGRPLSSAAVAFVNLVPPGSEYGPRRTQLDLRLAKTFRLGSTSIQGQVDFYNLFNINTPTLLNNTYGLNGATWQFAQSILSARLIKFGAQVSF